VGEHVQRALVRAVQGHRQGRADGFRRVEVDSRTRAQCLQGDPGAVVNEVGDHHRADDAEDDQPLCAERHALRAHHDAVVEEDEHTEQGQRREDLLREVVAVADQRAAGHEPEDVEVGVVAARPEDVRVETQHEEREEDADVGDARRAVLLVLRHLLLAERIAQEKFDALGDLTRTGQVDRGLLRASLDQLETTVGRPGEQRHGHDQNDGHGYRIHGLASSSAESPQDAGLGSPGRACYSAGLT